MNIISPYKYNEWINEAFLEIIKKVIKTVKDHGLYNDIHFYITFNTKDSKVIIPDYLRNQYPDSMTIVLQNQFYDLDINRNGFSIKLSFNGKIETLFITWCSITQLLDPASSISLKIDPKLSNHKPPSDEPNQNQKIIKFPKK